MRCEACVLFAGLALVWRREDDEMDGKEKEEGRKSKTGEERGFLYLLYDMI